MERPKAKPGDSIHLLINRVGELRLRLQKLNPESLASRTGSQFIRSDFESGEFHLLYWGNAVRLSFPGFKATEVDTGKELGPALQALLMYYFVTSDGVSQAGRWISFTDLPDGRFYTQAFQGYTGGELVRVFQDDHEQFKSAAKKLAGERQSLGDISYSFQLLPRIALLAVYWRGDEDFPSSYQILFDEAAAHHLPTDACAIAGSMLTRQLISAG